jgi:hypothetical protein
MSIYTSPEEDAEGKAWQIANTQIDAVEAMVGRHPDKFAVLRSPGDFERLRAGGRVTLALGMENGAPIGDDLAKIAAIPCARRALHHPRPQRQQPHQRFLVYRAEAMGRPESVRREGRGRDEPRRHHGRRLAPVR